MSLFYRNIVALALITGFCMLCSFTYAQGSKKSASPDFMNLRGINVNDLFKSRFFKDSTYTYTYVPNEFEEWVLNRKNLYQYNSIGRVVNETEYEYIEGVWKSKSRVRNSYNTNDLLSKSEGDVWSEVSQSWESHSKESYLYNSSSLVTSITEFGFQNEDWLPKRKIEFRYNFLKEPVSETVFILPQGELDWIPSTRVLLEYNVYNKLKTRTVQNWNDSSRVWVNQSNTYYEYDNGETLISTTSRVWDQVNDTWIEAKRLSIIYDEEGKVMGTEETPLSSNVPLSISSEDAQYDTEGNLNSVVLNFWDEDEGVWRESTKEVHYWSEYFIPEDHGLKSDIKCFYSNPHEVNTPWFCEALKEGLIYTVEVCDLQGRRHYSDQFVGGNVFRIERSLQPGFYMVFIRGGLDTHSEKILIRR